MSYITSYPKLLNTLRDYSTIIVGGIQRSGTTYSTYIIAKDLGYTIVDENSYGVSNKKSFLKAINEKNVVIQNVSLTHILDEIEPLNKSIVVWINRPDEDIMKSEDRIKWHPVHFYQEQSKYITKYGEQAKHFQRNSLMKKFFWHNYQKIRMSIPFVEIQFRMLKETSEYVPCEKRKNFSSKQIKI